MPDGILGPAIREGRKVGLDSSIKNFFIPGSHYWQQSSVKSTISSSSPTILSKPLPLLIPWLLPLPLP